MCAEAPDFPEIREKAETGTLPRWLTSLYARWLVWYCLGVALLWVVGIESLYGNPTPFHGLFIPAVGSVVIPLIMLAAFVPGYMLCRLVLKRSFPAARWVAAGGLGCLLLVGWAAHLVRRQALAQSITASQRWGLIWLDLRWHLLALLVFLVFVVWWCLSTRRILQEEPEGDPDSAPTSARPILVGLVVFSILFSFSVAMLRDGPEGITTAYERQSYEYISDIGAGLSIRGLFHDYNKLHPHLSMHSRVHPPGPVAILWLLSIVFLGRDPMRLSIATVLVGSLGIIPLYFWARDLAGRRSALLCCTLYALVPSIVLFTATSADILFTPLTITTLFLFWRALHKRSTLYALAAGAMYAVLSLISFSLLALGAYFAFVGLWKIRDRQLRYSVVQTAVLMVAAFLALHVFVRWYTGFDVIECFRLCKTQFETDQVNLDLITPRYPGYVFRFLNPLCWVFFAGVPVSLLFFWRLAKPESTTKALFIVFVLTLCVLDLLYLGRGEGERSAMYIFPFMVLPSAHLLGRMGQMTRSQAPAVATVCFLAFQCWLIEVCLFTYW